jgi:acetyl-CoA acetyltransferase
MNRLEREVAIVGVGYSSLSRGDEPDARQLTYDACRNAITDAGIEPKEVDGMFQYLYDSESPLVSHVQRMLGIPNLGGFFDLKGGGPSGLGPALAAAMAVGSGTCETAIAYRTLLQREGHNGRIEVPPTTAAGPDQFTAVYGHGAGIMANYALKKRRRIAELGGRAEDFGYVAINARRWSAMNERALLKQPITMDDYLGSRVIVDPLLLLDCDYPINGSCAIVITTGERARALANKPVFVDSIAWGTGAGADFNFLDDYLFGGCFPCCEHLWARSQFRPDDIDLLAIYDGFTQIPIAWIEALGLCGRGEFGDWVDHGNKIGPGGSMPMNTSGGMLAEGRLQGLGHVTEAAMQLRGGLGERQVPEARVAAVAGGGTSDCGAMLLYVE